MFTDIDIIIVVGITRLQVVDEVDDAPAPKPTPLAHFGITCTGTGIYSIVRVRRPEEIAARRRN